MGACPNSWSYTVIHLFSLSTPPPPPVKNDGSTYDLDVDVDVEDCVETKQWRHIPTAVFLSFSFSIYCLALAFEHYRQVYIVHSGSNEDFVCCGF